MSTAFVRSEVRVAPRSERRPPQIGTPALGFGSPVSVAAVQLLQRAGGNAAVATILGRAPIVHSPLTSPRFASDAKLQACAADRDRLRTGDRGAPVEKVQQALTDLGYDLAGVDGRYGPRTAAAVRAFKADNRLGYEQFGDVGPGTMGRLDLLFADPPRRFCPVDPPVAAAVQTEPEGSTGPTAGDGGCIDPPVPPGPEPVPPGPEPVPPGPEPVPPGPEPVPPGPEPVPPVPPPPGPKFDRDPAGCVLTEPPGAPTPVTPLPFTLDPSAPLPAKEAPLPLDSIKDTAPFWDHADAKKLAGEIAACYAARVKDPKKQRDVAELTADFDNVLQASFTRSQFGTPWWRLSDRLVQGLTNERATFKKKKPKATDADVEAHMQEIRHKQREAVRQWDFNGAWGWMVERRDRLDFETLGAPGGVKVGTVPEILSPDQRAAAIHDRLDKLKSPLNEKEKLAALAKAAATAGKPPEELTPEEKQQALADAEEAKLKAMRKFDESVFKQARIDAEQAANNLVVPTTADFAGWRSDPEKTPVHKRVLEILKAIEGTPGKFGKFGAGTYGGMSGNHASGGFKGRFRSLDMYPEGEKATAYFGKDPAFRFAEAIDTTAIATGFTYQILYDDYLVAREFNAKAHGGTGAAAGKMSNQDNVEETEIKQPDGSIVKRPANLNWHGPLVTHFHVDLAF